MTDKFLLFDMDGVLLIPGGYQQALKASVNRMGKALGAPWTEITSQQIAQFEALSITNEWDTLAICTALILIQVWRNVGDIRLTTNINASPLMAFPDKPDFQAFLNSFDKVGPLPGHSAYQKISEENTWLSVEQKKHLKDILYNCRDINNSLTLPSHQETVLGSRAFESNYALKPQLNIESFLFKFDKPALSSEQRTQLQNWLEDAEHYAGILTNRPSATPTEYVSSPEAEIGAKLVGLDEYPILGSGMLNWYAETQCDMVNHTFLKPNPVHALGLIQICLGQSPAEALKSAVELWRGESSKNPWLPLHGAKVFIVEDSVKGLQSGIAAKSILQEMDINIDLKLIGVTENSIKKQALLGVANEIVASINDYQWPV